MTIRIEDLTGCVGPEGAQGGVDCDATEQTISPDGLGVTNELQSNAWDVANDYMQAYTGCVAPEADGERGWEAISPGDGWGDPSSANPTQIREDEEPEPEPEPEAEPEPEPEPEPAPEYKPKPATFKTIVGRIWLRIVEAVSGSGSTGDDDQPSGNDAPGSRGECLIDVLQCGTTGSCQSQAMVSAWTNYLQQHQWSGCNADSTPVPGSDACHDLMAPATLTEDELPSVQAAVCEARQMVMDPNGSDMRCVPNLEEQLVREHLDVCSDPRALCDDVSSGDGIPALHPDGGEPALASGQGMVPEGADSWGPELEPDTTPVLSGEPASGPDPL